MKSELKKLKEKVKDQKILIEELNQMLEDVRADRQKFRNYFSKDLKWLIEIHGNRQYPSMSGYIEEKANFLNMVERFHW